MPTQNPIIALTAALVLAQPALAQSSIEELSPVEASVLRSSIVDALYRAEPVPGGAVEAANPAQQMRSRFEQRGVEVAGEDWSLDLSLEAWGRPSTLSTAGPGERVVLGRRVEYRRGGLVEWYVNEERGLEQGFTIDSSPAGDGPLMLVLSIEGGERGLSPRVLAGGRDASFSDAAGRVVLHYTGLVAWDASGRDLAASLIVVDGRLAIEVADEGATYPVVVDPWIGTELAKLAAADAASGDQFGYSVAVSGDTALVGAIYDDNPSGEDAGAAYVFARDQSGPNAWGEVAKLTASDGAAFELFGGAVAISGDTAVVGARWNAHSGLTNPGAAYVFERDQGGPDAWGEVAKLTASDAADFDVFGEPVAIDGDTIVAGAWLADPFGQTSAGAVYVFDRDQGGGGAWGEVAKLTASDALAFDNFGLSIAISGDTAVVGAYKDAHAAGVGGSASGEGSAYVFERDLGGANAWGEAAKLVHNNPKASDQFGWSVAVSVDTIIVGASADDTAAGADAGSVVVFDRHQGGAGAWGLVKKLKASDAVANGLFGSQVSLSGSTAVIGASVNAVQAVYVFEADLGGPSAWGESMQLSASDGTTADAFGYAVAIGGDTVLVGAPAGDTTAGTLTGSSYVFGLSSSSESYCTAGVSASGCQALLSSMGTPSATASSGFDLTASGVEGAKNGIFFFGTNGRQANAWGNGTSFQCVVPPVKRGGLLVGSGSVLSCAGMFTQDLNALWCPSCPKPAHNPGAGATTQAQLWYRDPLNTSNQTTSLSDAIEFTLQP